MGVVVCNQKEVQLVDVGLCDMLLKKCPTSSWTVFKKFAKSVQDIFE